MSVEALRYCGEAWAGGPGLVYDRLAAALVPASPVAITGARVIDIGAGSGAASRAVVAGGGRPVAVDLSLDMLSHRPGACTPAVLGDARRLPFADGGFDVAVAAFVLSHVPDPVRVLAEAGRVVRGGGAVLASSFSSASSHPAKAQVDEVATRWGWRPPPWYRQFKSELEPRVGHAAALVALAADAGLHDVVVQELVVDTGVCSADAMVAWRLGMAHLAPFVASLNQVDRASLIAEARTEMGPEPQPLRPVVLMLSSRAPAQPESVPA